MKTVEERFREKYFVDPETGCWRWTGAKFNNGYGQFRHDAECVAHRWAYRHFVGPIADGMTLDHVWERGCRYRECVNPDHLEPTTQKENNGRSMKARQTACIHGHPFSPENTYMKGNGTRACKECRRARKRKGYQALAPVSISARHSTSRVAIR